MKKNIETLLKETLSKAKYYETESDFLDDVENGYIADHVNERGVMRKAEELRGDYLDCLTCIEDVADLAWELGYSYGYDLNDPNDLDADELEELKDTLENLSLVYIDETDTYYMF